MTVDGRLLLLDTSVVLHLLRGKATGLAIDAAYSLRARPERPLVSVISVGEILSFAAQRGWGAGKVDQLKKLVEDLVVVDVWSSSVLQHYAAIDSFLVKIGRKVGDNDAWIAATAAATNAILLTTDKDFDPLDGHLITRIWFDPQVASTPKS
jgi:predicted nucleic acid-binding protein